MNDREEFEKALRQYGHKFNSPQVLYEAARTEVMLLWQGASTKAYQRAAKAVRDLLSRSKGATTFVDVDLAVQTILDLIEDPNPPRFHVRADSDPNQTRMVIYDERNDRIMAYARTPLDSAVIVSALNKHASKENR